MRTALPASSSPSRMSPQLPLETVADALMMYRFTVDQYQRLIEASILPEDGSYELLRGVILRKDNGTVGEDTLGHKPPHALVVTLLSVLIAKINSLRCHLRIQLPVVLSEDDAPEPDGSIVRGVPRDYATRLPTGADTFCVIEIAHSSLERDEGEKLPAYAAAGIQQYIVVNLRTNVIDEYSDPDPHAGVYNTHISHMKGETFRVNLGDGEFLAVPASDLLP